MRLYPTSVAAILNDCFDMVDDLTHYLYSDNMFKYIELFEGLHVHVDLHEGAAGGQRPARRRLLRRLHMHLNKLDDTAIPEIQRTNLGRVVVMLNSLDINDLVHFDFTWTLIRALEQKFSMNPQLSKSFR